MAKDKSYSSTQAYMDDMAKDKSYFSTQAYMGEDE